MLKFVKDGAEKIIADGSSLMARLYADGWELEGESKPKKAPAKKKTTKKKAD